MSHTITPNPDPNLRVQLEAAILRPEGNIPLQVLVDSEADDNFIDGSLVDQAGIPVEPVPDPKEVNVLDGRRLARITHITAPLNLLLSGNHRETIKLLVIHSPHTPVVLGLTWLKLHNPHIDWSTCSIASWSPFCLSHCLQSAVAPNQIPSTP